MHNDSHYGDSTYIHMDINRRLVKDDDTQGYLPNSTIQDQEMSKVS